MDGNPADWDKIGAISLSPDVSLKTFVEDGSISFQIESKGNERSPEEVFAGVGFYFDPFERKDNWNTPKNPKGDLGIYELKKDADGQFGAFCHIVQGTQAGSGSGVLFQGRMQPRFEVKTGTTKDGVFVEVKVPQVLLSPALITPGSSFGLNVSIPGKTGNVLTLAPMPNYESVADPGDMELSLALFGAATTESGE